MTTTTLTRAPEAPAPVATDHSEIEQDVTNASRILKTAAHSLAEAYTLAEGQTLSLDDAKHRYALVHRLANDLAVATALVDATMEQTAGIILAAHSHGDNIDIEGETFHRYDEVRANSTPWKQIAEKAESFLTGAQKGVITRMKAAAKAQTRTYFRLKPGPFVGKK